MGRLFNEELDEIGTTNRYYKGSNVDRLISFTIQSIGTPILAVGSGGSFSVAKAYEKMVVGLSGVCKAITPAELLSEKGAKNQFIILFTAGGNNSDIVNAYEYTRLIEPLNYLVVCLSSSSKVEKHCKKNHDRRCLAYPLPGKRDGFLAVNSIIAFLTMFQMVNTYISGENSSVEIQREDISVDSKFLEKGNVIALSGWYLSAVAIDFESKCAEAGLLAVQPIALRNFVHGRHNWISKKRDDTAIVAFIEPKERKVLTSILKNIPSIPTIIIESKHDGFLSILEVFPRMLSLVQQEGKARGIDPGRPGVQDFGKKTYHTSFSLVAADKDQKRRRRSLAIRALYRKNPHAMHVQDIEAGETQYRQFIDKIGQTHYDSLVLDYDGTIIERDNTESTVYQDIIKQLVEFAERGIKIGFATGRGSSIVRQLKRNIPEYLWGQISIACYNGSCTFHLDQSETELESQKTCEAIVQGKSLFKSITHLLGTFGIQEEHVQIRRYQASIKTTDMTHYKKATICKALKEHIALHANNLQLIVSDHSFDLAPSHVSKTAIAKELNKDHARTTLYIGDAGALYGSDFAILNKFDGLSVNLVSSINEGCWNLASLGNYGPNATKEYLSYVQMNADGTFCLFFE